MEVRVFVVDKVAWVRRALSVSRDEKGDHLSRLRDAVTATVLRR